MTVDAQKNDSERTGAEGPALPDYDVLGSAEDAQSRWRQEIEQVYCQLGLALPQQQHQFDAELTVRPFGDLRLGSISALPHRVWRTAEMASTDRRQDYLICLIAAGTATVSQGGRTASLERGAFALLDAARPFAYKASTDVEQLTVLTPRPLLDARIPEQLIVDLTAVPVRGDTGGGGLVSHFLRDVATSAPSPTGATEHGLSAPAIDMVATVLVGEMGGLSERRIAQAQDLLRAKAALEKGMHDADRTLTDVAAELGMSLRNLHKLFSTHGTTPNAWLYQARLERARQLLASTDLTVFEVCERVGFRDVSHFSRSFRQRFTQTPGQVRVGGTRGQGQAR